MIESSAGRRRSSSSRFCALSGRVLTLKADATTATATATGTRPRSAPVAFGTRRNNNAQAGQHAQPPHPIRQEFKVRITSARKLDGTVVVDPASVNFIVSGFHWPWVWPQPGVTRTSVSAVFLPPEPSWSAMTSSVFA